MSSHDASIFGFLLCMCMVVQASSALPTIASNISWRTESTHSINMNLKGDCSYTTSIGFNLPETPNTFLMTPFQPTKSEMRTYQKLPNTLTQANPLLLSNANYRGFYNWSFETKSQWQIPTDHPAQNRSNCYKLTILASTEKVLDLYQNFKAVSRTFYLLKNKYAVVHPSGAVMVDCGYYQGQSFLHVHLQAYN